MAADPTALRCAAHPRVETYLRCGRCERPICPRCMVQTPVGSRCRECAQVRRLPIYDVGPRFLLRGAAAGLGAATLAGVALLFIIGNLRFLGFIGMLLLGALFGYVVSEAVSRATNRKRGPTLIWTAIVASILGLHLARVVVVYAQLSLTSAQDPVARLGRALLLGFSPDLGLLLLLLVAAALAYNRLR